MIGIFFGIALIAVGCLWRMHQLRVDQREALSPRWRHEDLPEHERLERRFR